MEIWMIFIIRDRASQTFHGFHYLETKKYQKQLTVSTLLLPLRHVTDASNIEADCTRNKKNFFRYASF